MNNEGLIIRKKYVHSKLQTKSFKESITLMSKPLFKNNLIKENFASEVLKREEIYPTGLKIGEYNIAIPHTEAEYVNQSVLSVASLANPVKVKQMDDPSKILEVQLVFLLAIADKEKHLEVLSQIISLVQDQRLLKELIESDDNNSMYNIIKNKLHDDPVENRK